MAQNKSGITCTHFARKSALLVHFCPSSSDHEAAPSVEKALAINGFGHPSDLGSRPKHNLAKVGVDGSNPFARSRFCQVSQWLKAAIRGRYMVSALPFVCATGTGTAISSRSGFGGRRGVHLCPHARAA